MKIELCEDNGFLSTDGKPSLVVLVVTGDDGNQMRIPYAAKNTIATLYKDVKNFLISKNIDRIENVVAWDSDKEAIAIQCGDNIEKKFAEKDSKVIEREDIVKCIRLEKDLDGNVNEDITVGKTYRVIEIIKKDKNVVLYEVLDDEKNNKIRISVLPSEVMLFRKSVRTSAPRVQNLETIEKCTCGADVCLASSIGGKVYEGTCDTCRNVIKIPRKVNNAKSTS